MATATGTPITSAIDAVRIVPRISGHAPNVQWAPLPTAHAPPCWSWDTSQLLRTKKLPRPMWLNAVEDCPIRRTKKYPMRISTPAASALSPHFSTRSGSRCSGDRSRAERPPRSDTAEASI